MAKCRRDALAGTGHKILELAINRAPPRRWKAWVELVEAQLPTSRTPYPIKVCSVLPGALLSHYLRTCLSDQQLLLRDTLSATHSTEARCSAEGRAEVGLMKHMGEFLVPLMAERASEDQWKEWVTATLMFSIMGPISEDLVQKLLQAGATVNKFFPLTPTSNSSLSSTSLTSLAVNDIIYQQNIMCHRWSALHVAAGFGTECGVSAMLNAGALIEARCCGAWTPLHLAAHRGQGGAIRALIHAGASLRAKDELGKTPLHRAAGNNHTVAIHELLSAGADANATDNSLRTPLHQAARSGQYEGVQMLLRSFPDSEARDAYGRTPLWEAVDAAHLDCVALLLRDGANPNMPDYRGMTPLHTAAKNEDVPCMSALLCAGADRGAVTMAGATPLHFAAENKSGAVLLQLLRQAPLGLVGARALDGTTPLHRACKLGRVECVTVLLKHGALESDEDNEGNTPASLVPEEGEGEQEEGEGEGEGEEDDDGMGGGRGVSVVEAILQQLCNAKEERQWRRRGWLVMARARRMAAGCGGSQRGKGKEKGKGNCHRRSGKVNTCKAREELGSAERDERRGDTVQSMVMLRKRIREGGEGGNVSGITGISGIANIASITSITTIASISSSSSSGNNSVGVCRDEGGGRGDCSSSSSGSGSGSGSEDGSGMVGVRFSKSGVQRVLMRGYFRQRKLARSSRGSDFMKRGGSGSSNVPSQGKVAPREVCGSSSPDGSSCPESLDGFWGLPRGGGRVHQLLASVVAGSAQWTALGGEGGSGCGGEGGVDQQLHALLWAVVNMSEEGSFRKIVGYL